ncbi:FkbM family methyltransferase [Priestia flexa]|uniref:FkbM family methyltransferase n=1 Tax=Priestia flexa TaxID=86664 RepID=UPI001CD48DE9|nr:FkbM family methyltransferase [Priestia flexa]MCA1202391.1 FkbM family methyltransferase [Priestia flexa]
MRGTYIGNNKMLIHTAYNGKLVIPANDLGIGPDLIIHGVYDTGLTKYFINTVKKGDIVFDVGANVGLFTILAGYLVGETGKVYCYEASKDTYKFLLDNISMNWMRNIIIPYNKAVYSKRDSLRLNENIRDSGLASIYYSDNWKVDGYKDEIIQTEIEAIPLDIHFEEIDAIKLMKIDIEGAEYDAFLGLEKFMISKKIKNICVEWNITHLNDRAEPLLNLFSFYIRHGYSLYKMDTQGDLIPITIEALKNIRAIPNVVLKL